MTTPDQIHAAVARLTSPGEIFEVTQREIDGRRQRAYANASATLLDILQMGRAHGRAEFLVYGGRRWTFTEFFTDVDALAATLQHDLGVEPGDRVAIAMRNCADWVVAFGAAVHAGAVVVPINSWGSVDELTFSLTNSGSGVLVADARRLALAEPLLGTTGLTVLLGDLERGAPEPATRPGVRRLDDAVEAGRGRVYELSTPAPDDVAVLLYTSGSTGHPKGVIHRNLAIGQAVMNLFFVGYLAIETGGAIELRGGATAEAQLVTVPLFHATGLLSGLVLPCAVGQKAVILPKWDPVAALQAIEAEKLTMMSTVPTILKDFLTHPDFPDYDTSSLIRATGAGAATPADLPGLLADKLGIVNRSAGYGMTESMAVAATMSGPVFDLKPTASGILSPIIDMRFADASGDVLAAGEEGEIQLRGVTMTLGYWDLPDATRDAFTKDGWYRTGDVGHLDDDGYLHVTGRIKEMVIRGGENIYPAEIENAAYRHAGVKEAAVFGVPDAHLGEELAIVCYLQPDACLTEADLREHLTGILANHKVPRFIALSDVPLPRNASEKIHRLGIRQGFLPAAQS
ncbi:class I adenylate-forming enzyme family protein [soil metagenome]